MMSGRLVAKVAAVIAIAAVAGFAAALLVALVGHEVLVAVYGEEGIPAIDDTLPMFVAVTSTYLAGFLAGLAVTFLGWRRVNGR